MFFTEMKSNRKGKNMRFYILFFLLVFPSFLIANNLQKAKELKENGKLTEAIEVLKSEGSLEAKKFLAKIYLEVGEFNEALSLYESVCPQIKTHDCYNELAITQASLEKYGEAIQNFQNAIQLEPQSASTYSALAMAYFLNGDEEKAEQTHLTALEMNPMGIIPRINYGVFLVKTKKYERAKTVLYSVIAENKSLYYAELYLGLAHYMKEEYNTALIHFNRGIEINPEYYDLYYYRALLYYKKGDYLNSLEDLKMVDKLYPNNNKSENLRKLIRKNVKF